MPGGDTEDVLGYRVFAAGTGACVESIMLWLGAGDRAQWLACLNPHSYVVALECSAFASALRDASWLIPDGVGIVLASKFRGGGIRERVTGSDIFLELTRRLNERGGARYFFLGATEDTLQGIRERMASDFPQVEVVGTYSPPFRREHTDAEIEEMIAAINRVRPDVLWVGMTAPKQELWIQRVRGRVNVRFAAAIGAVFDFYTGRVKRSHPAFRRLGLEWLPRLVQEPRRLWRRTFVSTPLFLWHVFRRAKT